MEEKHRIINMNHTHKSHFILIGGTSIVYHQLFCHVFNAGSSKISYWSPVWIISGCFHHQSRAAISGIYNTILQHWNIQYLQEKSFHNPWLSFYAMTLHMYTAHGSWVMWYNVKSVSAVTCVHWWLNRLLTRSFFVQCLYSNESLQLPWLKLNNYIVYLYRYLKFNLLKYWCTYIEHVVAACVIW